MALKIPALYKPKTCLDKQINSLKKLRVIPRYNLIFINYMPFSFGKNTCLKSKSIQRDNNGLQFCVVKMFPLRIWGNLFFSGNHRSRLKATGTPLERYCSLFIKVCCYTVLRRVYKQIVGGAARNMEHVNINA